MRIHADPDPQSWSEPVLSGWIRCEDAKAKTVFYLFLAYFYMKRSRSRWKKVPGAAAVPKKGPVLQHCIGPTNTHDFTCFFPLLLNYLIIQFKAFPQYSPPPLLPFIASFTCFIYIIHCATFLYFSHPPPRR